VAEPVEATTMGLFPQRAHLNPLAGDRLNVHVSSAGFFGG